MRNAASNAMACQEYPDPSWTTTGLLQRRNWRLALDAEVIDEFLGQQRIQSSLSDDSALSDLRPVDSPCRARFAWSLRQQMLHGDGVAWIEGGGSSGMSQNEMRAFFLSLGASMGRVMTEYGDLYSVSDRGVDYTREAAPISMTSAATGMHTDSSAINSLPDFVGLLCEEPSLNGGDSLISNASNAYRQLQLSTPGIAKILEENFVRDLVTPGTDKDPSKLLQNTFPIFSSGRGGRGISFRYMRYWIEKGQERSGRPLGARYLRALDRLDEALASPKNQLRLRLSRGDILWVNNRTLAHGRESYLDTPGNRRQLQRLWIDVPEE